MNSKTLTDPLEIRIAAALEAAGVVYEDEHANGKGLDFYLPEYGVYLEVKGGHSDRVAGQMKRDHNVIVIQGVKSVAFVVSLLKRYREPIKVNELQNL